LPRPGRLTKALWKSSGTDQIPNSAFAAEKGSGANAREAGDDEEMQRFVPIEDLFKGRHFDRQIIVLCVSRYTRFKLSLRDLEIMMADRGISVTHTTILWWVQRYLPGFEVLAALRSTRRRVVENGRDLPPHADNDNFGSELALAEERSPAKSHPLTLPNDQPWSCNTFIGAR
jgi:hypothetical protein